MSVLMTDLASALLITHSDIDLIRGESYQERFGFDDVLGGTHHGPVRTLDDRIATAKGCRGRQGDQPCPGMGQISPGPVQPGAKAPACTLGERQHLLVPAVYLGGGLSQHWPGPDAREPGSLPVEPPG